MCVCVLFREPTNGGVPLCSALKPTKKGSPENKADQCVQTRDADQKQTYGGFLLEMFENWGTPLFWIVRMGESVNRRWSLVLTLCKCPLGSPFWLKWALPFFLGI